MRARDRFRHRVLKGVSVGHPPWEADAARVGVGHVSALVGTARRGSFNRLGDGTEPLSATFGAEHMTGFRLTDSVSTRPVTR